MKKILIILLFVLGTSLLILGIVGIYTTYRDYNTYWSATHANPDLLILTPYGELYDKSWIAFNKACAISILGLFLIYLADKKTKLNKGKMYIGGEGYLGISVIFILIGAYFTLFDPYYPFEKKMFHNSIENLVKEKEEEKK